LEKVWELIVEKKVEYPGYDGWYNNRAHPEWGAAGKCDALSVIQPIRREAIDYRALSL